MSGSASSSSVKRLKFDSQFRDIQTLITGILAESFGATLNQQAFQETLFSILQPEFTRLLEEGDLADELGTGEARQKFLRETIERNNQLAAQSAELSKQLASQVKNLGTLTETDRQLISSAVGNARAVGQQEIDDFVASNFRAANEVAAARGLRPTDAPVGNIRGRVAEEATSQKGLLESQLAARAAELAIQLPNQRAQTVGQIAASQGALAQGGQEFEAALAQNAQANRLNLASTTGQLGLGLTGLANVGTGALQASRPAFAVTEKSASGGISTRLLKVDGGEINSAEVLRRLQALPIRAWQYLWEHPEENVFHIGPYAEDFKEAFGGDAFQINFLHALGVSMVALQEVTGRLERIEAFLDLGNDPDRAAEAT